MIAKIILHSDKDSLWETGERIGLEGDALRRFRFAASEIELTLDVNKDTGTVDIIELDGRKVVSKFKVEPSLCSITDGTQTVEGLKPSSSYYVTYDENGKLTAKETK